MTPFPAPPDVQPPAEQPYWAVLDIALEFRFDAGFISCLTDTPCHLYLNATLQEPSYSPRYRIRRGAQRQTVPLWRNGGGLWFPQHEPGDTTTHTFSLGGWPEGISVWYYFDGYVEGLPTVSSSILFGSMRPPLDFTPELNLSAAATIVSPLFGSPGASPTVTLSFTSV